MSAAPMHRIEVHCSRDRQIYLLCFSCRECRWGYETYLETPAGAQGPDFSKFDWNVVQEHLRVHADE